MSRTCLPQILPFLAVIAALLALPNSASAMLVGAESNGALANSDRTPALQAAALNRMQAQGVQIVRVNFGWSELAANCGGRRTLASLKAHTNPCYNWAVLDSLVTLTKARKMTLLLSTSRAPRWLHGRADEYYLGATPTQFRKTVLHYAAFLSAAGTRYGANSSFGTIKYWTIWNEPNSDTFFKPMVSKAAKQRRQVYYADVYARKYAQMYGAAAVALRLAHRTAQIAPGPTGPNSFHKPALYIAAFQKYAPLYLPKRNPRSYINAWAHNPYPGNTTAPLNPRAFSDPNAIGMGSMSKLFRILDSKPLTRGLKVWGTEFGWQTPPETNPALVVSMGAQAQYLAEAYDLLSRTNRVPIAIWYGLQDPPGSADWQSGTFGSNGVAKPSFYMYQRMISVPKSKVKRGSRVAIWGRSTINQTKGVLVYRRGAAGQWYTVPGQRRAADGSIKATLTISSAITQFALYDGKYGYYRQVTGT
ncbi:MAG: hypothetical protein JWM25_138 [Thermoleophilia bacterium]|nr:hypothetical protein [Thermoleophilia bacterium]